MFRHQCWVKCTLHMGCVCDVCAGTGDMAFPRVLKRSELYLTSGGVMWFWASVFKELGFIFVIFEKCLTDFFCC